MVKTVTGKKIAQKASRLFLLERIRVLHHDKKRAEEKVVKIENELKKSISSNDYEKISQITILSGL